MSPLVTDRLQKIRTLHGLEVARLAKVSFVISAAVVVAAVVVVAVVVVVVIVAVVADGQFRFFATVVFFLANVKGLF